MRRQALALGATVLAVAGLAMLGVSAMTATRSASADGRNAARRPVQPIIISHRGASGHLPEHTLEAYKLSIGLGADYIEPDLVLTRDGVLVARHGNEMSHTTDIGARPDFADRRRTKVVNGHWVTGWFTEDFTLAELRTLRAIESMPVIRPGNTAFDGRYQVPSLTEIIDLVRSESRRLRRTIGIYPEIKYPAYYRSIGRPIEEPLVATLRKTGLDTSLAKIYIQSFDTTSLRILNRLIDVPLIQLIEPTGAPYDFILEGDTRTFDDLVTRAGLRWIRTYADGIGPEKSRILPRQRNNTTGWPTALVSEAHAAGLVVHAWTFRNENAFLPRDLRRGGDPAAWGDALGEYRYFYRLGIDGVFSDHPQTALEARLVRGLVPAAGHDE